MYIPVKPQTPVYFQSHQVIFPVWNQVKRQNDNKRRIE